MPCPDSARLQAERPGILVADDEIGIRNLLKVALEERGFEVCTAPNGFEAIDAFIRHRPQIRLALLDVRMPLLDGVQTLTVLKAVNPTLRVCFMSGDMGQYTALELLGHGAAYVFVKPLRIANVCEIVSDLVKVAPT